MNQKRRFFLKHDAYITLCTVASFLIGLLIIFSATRSMSGSSRYLILQTAAFFIGAVALFLIQKFDYDSLGQLAPYIYGINVTLLVVVLVIGEGRESVGTKGWIRFGSIGIQPSELVKIGFIITFAKHIEHVHSDLNNFKNILALLLHAGLLIGLILMQPDAGTAMVFAMIMLLMLFVAGISWKYIVSAFGTIAAAAPLIWFYVLKDYQKGRIISFFSPESDPLGRGYHVIQSKIAIGSGQVVGRGLFSGIQTQLGFLPEKQTDFIFAVIGEELGLWGCLLVCALLLTIVCRIFYIAANSRDLLGELLCTGVGAMFMFHVIENIGMCVGLTPVTGIPLPFFSYGGSNIIASMLGIALVMLVSGSRNRRI